MKSNIKVNQRQQQNILTQIRGSIIRNFHYYNQNTQTCPDWRWNSEFSKHLWSPDRENPNRNWFYSVSHLGLWHKWQEFALFYENAKICRYCRDAQFVRLPLLNY